MEDPAARVRAFLRELKHRNVYRVAATYAAVAFVGFEAARLLIPSTVLPGWSDEFILSLLVVGFPVALVVAWAFELTPEGVRRSPAPGTTAGDKPPAPSGGRSVPETDPPSPAAAAQPAARRDRRSVAVLPFANVSPDAGDEYLGDGITEELIGALAGIAGLRVAARTSVFAYKGRTKDVRTVGRELGVGSVLDGSVRKAGDRLRISAELVDTVEGYQLWSRTFDRTLEDVFAIQEEIAHAIVDHLKVGLLRPEAELVTSGTEDAEAYNDYLEGRYHLNRRTWRALHRAVEAFGRAARADPGFARAHAGLADAHLLLERYGVRPPGESLPVATSAALRAIELDATLPEPHVSLAYARMIGDWDLAAATREFRRALELDPDHAPAHHWFGWCLAAQGRPDEAISELERARALEPLSLIVRTNIGTVLYFGRRFDEARTHLEDALELNPSFAVALQWLGRVHQAEGRLGEAVEAFRRASDVLESDPESMASLGHALGRAGRREEAARLREELEELAAGERYVSPYWLGLVLLGVGEEDRGLEQLERAFDVRFDWLLFLGVDPLFDRHRDHPRFEALLRDVAGATTPAEG